MTYPPDFACPDQKWIIAQTAAHLISQVAPARRTVVQAGGCAGLWPLALAQYFEQVYTFEPEPTNFACLTRNIQGRTNITASNEALGAATGRVGLTRPKAGAGLWRTEGDGDICMVPLDARLDGVVVDALVLDVEGAEVSAWQGAERLITQQHPLLWFECLHNTPAIDTFLATHGYPPPTRGAGADCYSVHAVHEKEHYGRQAE